jgi:hypothetical protein
LRLVKERGLEPQGKVAFSHDLFSNRFTASPDDITAMPKCADAEEAHASLHKVVSDLENRGSTAPLTLQRACCLCRRVKASGVGSFAEDINAGLGNMTSNFSRRHVVRGQQVLVASKRPACDGDDRRQLVLF